MDQLNPLAFPEVLGSVFKYLGLRELLICRKVCRLWDTEASPFISQKVLICINDISKLSQLHDLIKSNAALPFRAYELWSFRINLDCDETLGLFTACGPYFHHLTLNFGKDSEHLLNIRTLRDLFLYYLPNLKSLALRELPLKVLSQKRIFPLEGEGKFQQPLLKSLKHLTIYSDGDYNKDFLCNIFNATHSLKSITIEYGDEPKDFKRTLLSAIFSSENLGKLETLKYFLHNPGAGHSWAWSAEDCRQLADAKLPLRCLKLHPSEDVGTSGTYHLLQNLHCLEHMKLRVHDELRCPKMLNLISITLHDYEGSLKFVSQLPNLKRIGLCEYSPAKMLTPENIVPNEEHNGVISLNLYGSYTISTPLFRAIAKCFKQLRILHFWHIDNAKLKVIIESFPLLEELTVNITKVDDGALSGFPNDLCEDIERSKNYGEYLSSPELFRQSEHIGQLKNLRRLEMHGASIEEWQWSSVTDVSVYLGIADLPALTSLSLHELKWISEASILHLCRMLPLMYLKLDLRVFASSIVTDIKTVLPDVTLESVTDEFEFYISNNPFYACIR